MSLPNCALLRSVLGSCSYLAYCSCEYSPCSSGRAKSDHEQPWKAASPSSFFKEHYYLATRLFGAGQEQELPLGCFEKVLDFWWRG